MTWRSMLLIAHLAAVLAGCGGAPSIDPDAMPPDLAPLLVRPAVAAYLVDPQLRDAEEIRVQPGMEIKILHRRDQADADHQQMRLLVRCRLAAVMLPPIDPATVKPPPPGADVETLQRFRMEVLQKRKDSAKRIPQQKRTIEVDVVRQILLPVRRVAGAWQAVLPADLESDGGHP